MSQGPNVYGQNSYDVDPAETGGWDATGSAGRTKPSLPQVLWAATGVFGLAAWAVGLAAVVPPGFPIPLAVLAGAVAVTGLLPGQTVRGWLAVAVAVTAFADAVTTTVTAGGEARVLIVVDVLVALQVVVAVSALLLEPRGSAGTQAAPESDYAGYAQYVRDYWEYAQQYGANWPDQHSATGAADAAGDARGTVAGTVRSDQDAWADMQAKYAQHVSPLAPAASEPTVRRADGGVTADTGMPGADRTDRAYEGPGQAAPGPAPTSPGAY
ncbi:DUF5336 domain-containing protein [Mycolicibacterium baixiangningiae]|uniref:DUF5336 domain-containing protein n=1 Tax=Mycolicibacterium baixiangningiae TaxID=2761578 RepID=UPI0018D0283A|nr:DUF5336 domain-containing protein [Mycolicibacterium baixiangningiae]